MEKIYRWKRRESVKTLGVNRRNVLESDIEKSKQPVIRNVAATIMKNAIFSAIFFNSW